MQSSQNLSLDIALTDFLRFLAGRNASGHTIEAYRTDIRQFLDWLSETTVVDHTTATISKSDLLEFLAYLADLGRSGVTRARKVISLREFFRFLAERGDIAVSPAASLTMPKKERKQQIFLRPDEYSRLLSAAGSPPLKEKQRQALEKVASYFRAHGHMVTLLPSSQIAV